MKLLAAASPTMLEALLLACGARGRGRLRSQQLPMDCGSHAANMLMVPKATKETSLIA